ncbi:hypothetical protein JG688_00013011 [Phytophthora aleatoria]|uniref:Uncharacterized protein n=1 Tax=Phytophthora aleatoria TaxID=2496075 RepID=A0A8J5MEJ4_9STRA|nr:hypothetical protein JG688_00013011 [Phytophthora aleatoria]
MSPTKYDKYINTSHGRGDVAIAKAPPQASGCENLRGKQGRAVFAEAGPAPSSPASRALHSPGHPILNRERSEPSQAKRGWSLTCEI